MKKLRVIAFVLVIATFLSLNTFAISNRASDQLKSYSISITPSSGKILVTAYVFGDGQMNKIGCESIEIYDKNGSRWDSYVDLDEDDDYMSSTNIHAYAHTFEFDATKNVEYMVSVTIFAENDDGRDTRSKTEYVTGR